MAARERPVPVPVSAAGLAASCRGGACRHGAGVACAGDDPDRAVAEYVDPGAGSGLSATRGAPRPARQRVGAGYDARSAAGSRLARAEVRPTSRLRADVGRGVTLLGARPSGATIVSYASGRGAGSTRVGRAVGAGTAPERAGRTGSSGSRAHGHRPAARRLPRRPQADGRRDRPEPGNGRSGGAPSAASG